MKAGLVIFLWLLLGFFYWKQSKVCCGDGSLPAADITSSEVTTADNSDTLSTQLTQTTGSEESDTATESASSEESPSDQDGTSSSQIDLDNKSYIYFSENKSSKDLSEDERKLIGQIARRLRNNSNRVCLNGHSGQEGDDATNYQLGYNRAQFIKDWLVRCGVSPHRILTYSKGAKRPLDSNDSSEGENSNRRVELIFID